MNKKIKNNSTLPREILLFNTKRILPIDINVVAARWGKNEFTAFKMEIELVTISLAQDKWDCSKHRPSSKLSPKENKRRF